MRTLAQFLIILGVASAVHAAPGDLDTTFSGDGKVLQTGLGSASTKAVAIQTDGKIVAVGTAADDFVVLRYHPVGTLDLTFSGDGIVTTSFGSSLSIDSARAVAIQSNGKIVVAGQEGSQSNPGVGLARYNTNGTLDTTFSGDGILEMEFAAPGGGAAAGVAIQTDGKIVVVGSSGSDFAVARLNTDGTLDATFGPPPGGIVTRDFGSANEGAIAVAIQTDGRIVVAGSSVIGGRTVFVFDRFSTTGFPEFIGPSDPAVNGSQHTSFGGGVDAFLRSMAIQADGKVVLAGDTLFVSGGGQVGTGVVERDMGIARYNTDGTMDTTFSTDGLRGIEFAPSSFASAVAVQPDGKIVVAGRAETSGTLNLNFALARLNTNGSLDLTFSGDGLLTTDFSSGATTRDDFGSAVAIQRNNGRIVVAGSAAGNVALARYHAFACNGANVTILGTNGSETIPPFGLVGGKPDVILGLGGNDTINGGGGDDFLCGGDGSSTLNGGPGNDVLIAGFGTDHLNGDDGSNDICHGSNLGVVFDPPDTFSGCETVNTGTAGLSGEWLEIDPACNRSRRHPRCRLDGSLRVFNPGAETTAVASQVAFFLSEDEALDESDSFLTIERVPALGAGEESIVELKVKLERELPDGEDDAGFFVLAVVDFFDDVSERNETNNVAVSPPITERGGCGRR